MLPSSTATVTTSTTAPNTQLFPSVTPSEATTMAGVPGTSGVPRQQRTLLQPRPPAPVPQFPPPTHAQPPPSPCPEPVQVRSQPLPTAPRMVRPPRFSSQPIVTEPLESWGDRYFESRLAYLDKILPIKIK